MAHLIYKPQLIGEKRREDYIDTRRKLNQARKRGDIDSSTYRDAKKTLEVAVNLPIPEASELESDEEDITELAMARSKSVSSGSTGHRTDRSNSLPSIGLAKSMTGSSTRTGKTMKTKSIRKGESLCVFRIRRNDFSDNLPQEQSSNAMTPDDCSSLMHNPNLQERF